MPVSSSQRGSETAARASAPKQPSGFRAFVESPRSFLAQMILCPLIVVGTLVGAVLFDRWWIPMTIMFLIALVAIFVFIATVFDLLSDGTGPLTRP